ncbi:YceI family protein [Thermomonas carbonis]|uniref:Polyisoprenoid-binding protein n=1 Tax=Thermomonas carbonis TaxID=1463158 RepID=A0A7G9SR97_9GAMM|nr:polyisoprenoid-binding protein [Thermomonas carbonis]GHB99583.1 polyisoprenoid-binding protein [Thermomonas carbonis]
MVPRQRLTVSCLPALLVALTSVPAVAGETARYAFDPVHTRVLFAIDHAGFSKAIGTISGSEGSLHFDVDDWSSARLDVVVPMHKLDMGDSDWTASVFAPRFLDVKRYPQARFVATNGLQREAGNRGRACGQLTLHGVTRPLCLDIVMNKAGRYPLPPFRRTIGFSATAMLKRSDYGMTRWQSLVGDDIELRIEAELFRRDGEDAQPAQPDAPSIDPSTPIQD